MNEDKAIGALLIWVIWPGLAAEIAACSVNSLAPHNTIAWVTAFIGGFVFWWGIYLSIWLIGKGTP